MAATFAPLFFIYCQTNADERACQLRSVAV
jgi:hypothetical protein